MLKLREFKCAECGHTVERLVADDVHEMQVGECADGLHHLYQRVISAPVIHMGLHAASPNPQARRKLVRDGHGR